MKTKKPVPFPARSLFGHRGASAQAPENTLAAFQAAHDLKIPWVEFDIQQCQTGEWVVFHDETLNRTTSGSGLLKDTSLQTLKGLDAGSWFSSRYSGEKVPTLVEVVELMQKIRLSANIELKTLATPSEEALQDLLNIVKPVQDHVLFSSYHVGTLQAVRRLSDLPIGYIVVTPTEADLHFVISEDWNTYHIQYDHIQPAIIQQAQANQIPLLAYTVNDKKILESLYQQGITAVFSDLTKDILAR